MPGTKDAPGFFIESDGPYMKTPTKSACVIANGCPENRLDGARIQSFFSENGFTITSDYREADIIFFRPCGGFMVFEEEAIGIIKQIQSNMRPSAELIVCGCLPKINQGSLDEVHDGLIFGAEDFDWLDNMFGERMGIQNVHANFLIPNTLSRDLSSLSQGVPKKGVPYPDFYKILRSIIKYEPFRSLNSFRKKLKQMRNPIHHDSCSRPKIRFYTENTFYIKISTGCLYACSYCAIRLSRGKLKSKPIRDIVHEFEEGLKKGYKEIALIGTETGSYGKDQGTDLVRLLNTLINKDGDFKLRLRNVHPRFLVNRFSEFKEILKSGKIDFVISSIQSGNNRILKLMNRKYRADDVREIFDTISTEFPNVYLGTQFIVGFPSETDEEFHDTLRLSQNIKLDLMECFRFEPRLGTKAAEMKEQFPKEVINERFNELQKARRFLPKLKSEQTLKSQKTSFRALLGPS